MAGRTERDKIPAHDGEVSEKVVELAVKGMLPHNSLGRAMFRKLKVYRGSEHEHQAQKPEVLEINV